jgi:hypothetical protein
MEDHHRRDRPRQVVVFAEGRVGAPVASDAPTQLSAAASGYSGGGGITPSPPFRSGIPERVQLTRLALWVDHLGTVLAVSDGINDESHKLDGAIV